MRRRIYSFSSSFSKHLFTAPGGVYFLPLLASRVGTVRKCTSLSRPVEPKMQMPPAIMTTTVPSTMSLIRLPRALRNLASKPWLPPPRCEGPA